MTPYLTCDAARDLLEAFVDDELRIEQQVAVESHLRWCRVCSARVADMRLVGDSMRLIAAGTTYRTEDAHDLGVIQAGVLARVGAERDQSMLVQCKDLFEDMRLLWPALGASAAVMACLFAATAVFAMATAEENSRSMAAVIETLANPGSDRNPIDLDARMSAPRSLDTSLVFDSVLADDTAYTVSAVVTREGRVANYELLLADGPGGRRHSAAATDLNSAALLAAVKRTRFAPAQDTAGDTVAVNVVWLVARTTVKGSARVELALPQGEMISVRVPPRSQKPADDAVRRPAAPRSPTA